MTQQKRKYFIGQSNCKQLRTFHRTTFLSAA